MSSTPPRPGIGPPTPPTLSVSNMFSILQESSSQELGGNDKPAVLSHEDEMKRKYSLLASAPGPTMLPLSDTHLSGPIVASPDQPNIQSESPWQIVGTPKPVTVVLSREDTMKMKYSNEVLQGKSKSTEEIKLRPAALAQPMHIIKHIPPDRKSFAFEFLITAWKFINIFNNPKSTRNAFKMKTEIKLAIYDLFDIKMSAMAFKDSTQENKLRYSNVFGSLVTAKFITFDKVSSALKVVLQYSTEEAASIAKKDIIQHAVKQKIKEADIKAYTPKHLCGRINGINRDLSAEQMIELKVKYAPHLNLQNVNDACRFPGDFEGSLKFAIQPEFRKELHPFSIELQKLMPVRRNRTTQIKIKKYVMPLKLICGKCFQPGHVKRKCKNKKCCACCHQEIPDDSIHKCDKSKHMGCLLCKKTDHHILNCNQYYIRLVDFTLEEFSNPDVATAPVPDPANRSSDFPDIHHASGSKRKPEPTPIKCDVKLTSNQLNARNDIPSQPQFDDSPTATSRLSYSEICASKPPTVTPIKTLPKRRKQSPPTPISVVNKTAATASAETDSIAMISSIVEKLNHITKQIDSLFNQLYAHGERLQEVEQFHHSNTHMTTDTQASNADAEETDSALEDNVHDPEND